MAGPGGNPIPVNLLTKKEWLEQRLPYNVSNFGATTARRNTATATEILVLWDGVPTAVDHFVGLSDDSDHRFHPFNPRVLRGGNSEAHALFSFQYALLEVCGVLGHLGLDIDFEVPVYPSPSPDAGADQRLQSFVGPRITADIVVSHNGKQIVAVEMKRPVVFRRSVNAAIPRLDLLGDRGGASPPTEDVVRFEAVQQLYGYMVGMNLGFGILSSFDLTYVVHRQGRRGDTLFISEGFPSTSHRFLGLLAFILEKAINEPTNFERPGPNVISPTTGGGSLKRQGSKGDKEKEKEKSDKWQFVGMKTWGQGLVYDVGFDGLPKIVAECDGLPDTPAELLHLERHHFTTGWSGRIVRGTYEGQSIVVKLVPIGSDRAKALLTEVWAYNMLKEFGGKYVPQLVSYGTTVGGTIMYIATEDIRGYEIGMGPLSQEVVEEIFDALAALHQCGILHGDIRPSNILVAQGQQAGVRFIDFGFAHSVTSDEGCKRENAQLVSLVSEFTYSDVDATSQLQLEQSQVV